MDRSPDLYKKTEYFLRHLESMQRAYNDLRVLSEGVEKLKNRTDEILVNETQHEFTLTCAGTEPKIRDWFYNLTFIKVGWINMGKVHSGFAYNVDELLGRQDQPTSLLSRCLRQADAGKMIVIEGHSRGAPIAILVASTLVAHSVDPNRILVIGCGGAKVGNKQFARSYHEMLGHRTYILNGYSDPVRHLPPWGRCHGRVKMIKLGGWFPKHRVKHYIRALKRLKKRA